MSSIQYPLPLHCPVCETIHEIALDNIKWVSCFSCFSSLRVTATGLVDEGGLPNAPKLKSRLNLGAQGLIRKKKFAVLGNVVFLDEDGDPWQEWFLMLDDRSTIWMAEDDGLFTLYAESVNMVNDVPPFEDVQIGQYTQIGPYQIKVNEAEEVEVAFYGGQVTKHGRIGERYRYIEGTFKNYCATFEYTDADTINLFFGTTLKPDELEL